MTHPTYFEVRLSPLREEYAVSRDGDPVYGARVAADGDLVFRTPGGEPAFRVEDRLLDVESGYHVVEAASDTVLGRVVDDVALFGRRWELLDADGERVALLRDRGKLGALVHELGLETGLPVPSAMSVVLPSGRATGTVRRKVGIGNTTAIDLDAEHGLDERLVLAAALVVDRDDRLDRAIARRGRRD